MLFDYGIVKSITAWSDAPCACFTDALLEAIKVASFEITLHVHFNTMKRKKANPAS